MHRQVLLHNFSSRDLLLSMDHYLLRYKNIFISIRVYRVTSKIKLQNQSYARAGGPINQLKSTGQSHRQRKYIVGFKKIVVSLTIKFFYMIGRQTSQSDICSLLTHWYLRMHIKLQQVLQNSSQQVTNLFIYCPLLNLFSRVMGSLCLS